MNPKKTYNIITKIALLGFMGYTIVPVWAECRLTASPSEPLNSYALNIETIITAIENRSKDTKCTPPSKGAEAAAIIMQAQSIRGIISSMQGLGSDFRSLGTEQQYYFDQFRTIPDITKSHESYLNDIQVKLLDTARLVGGRCAQSQIFEENIPLKNSEYKTKDRTIKEVLSEAKKQTTQVENYLKNLLSNIADRNYEDESRFSMAPQGFSLAMKTVYNHNDIQSCLNAEPKNQAIKQLLRETFLSGWKYPQAVSIWKEAFQLLIYRGSQLFGSKKIDPSKEAQIQAIVARQKGGISASGVTLNAQFLSEFQQKFTNGTLMETIKEYAKRAAYQSFNETFDLGAIGEVFGIGKTQKALNLAQISEFDEKAKNLSEIEKGLYDRYAERKVLIGQNKTQNPKTVAGIVESINIAQKMRKINEENVKIACENMTKQGQNIDKPKCADFLKAQ